MKEPILQAVKQFLKQNLRQQKPLILGLSGGPDSMALLHLLLESQGNFSLHIAHVDHRWRCSSTKEAEILEKYAKKLNLPFHLHTLEKGCRGEAAAREERLLFFSTLFKQIDAQALVLGHHGDDLAETVLKRILEGAPLSSCGGISLISSLRDMVIWRPLISLTKKEIYSFLKKREIPFFEDKTNQDTHFLRARMRSEILPTLNAQFGKEVSANLCRIGASMQELKEYLDCQNKKYFSVLERNASGVVINFNSFAELPSFEIKAFFKKVSHQEGFLISHDSLEKLFHLIKSDASKKKIICGKKIIEIHRRMVAIKNL